MLALMYDSIHVIHTLKSTELQYFSVVFHPKEDRRKQKNSLLLKDRC